MDRVPVRSSNLKSIGHDASSHTLEVEFHDSGVYQYHGAPVRVYEDLMSSDSLGRFLHRNVKGTYRHSKLG